MLYNITSKYHPTAGGVDMAIAQTIDTKKLAVLANGLITYERAEHDVDPRDTLEGTTFRLESDEGYKYGVYKRSQKKLNKGGSYVNIVQSAIADGNLVSFYQKGYLDDLISEKGPEDLEQALELLYEGDDDQEAFHEIVDYIGGRFDIVGLIFFIKDCDKYLPIRSSIFDKKFAVLGIDSELDSHCSWDKYQEYIGWIRDIQQFLVKHINKDITLLDAHSFVWIVDGIQDYITEGVQLVEHKKFGTGKIVGYEDEYVLVKFGKTVRKFDKKNAFENGFLKLVPSDYRIYKDDEEKNEPKTVQSSNNKSFIVFQGGQYEKEYASGYLWAPYKDKSGKTPHHWARMKELKPGDTVFHYSAGYIRAISTVTKSWVDSKRLAVLSQDETWKLKGMKVECDPIILDDPIDVYEYTDEILKYRKEKSSGFNINGGANEGYLFELEPELAELFENAAGLNKTKQIAPLSKKALEVAEVLLERVRDKAWPVTYGELSNATNSKPTTWHEIPKILDAINARCEVLGLPYISAMVINKDTGLPGKGFRQLYEEHYGYDSSISTEEIFKIELKRIEECDRWESLAHEIGVTISTDEDSELTSLITSHQKLHKADPEHKNIIEIQREKDQEYPREYVTDLSVTKEQWLDLIDDSAIFHDSDIELLKKIYLHDNHAVTPSDLSLQDGVSPTSYIAPVVALARRITDALGLDPIYRDNGSRVWWRIPFWGRYVDGIHFEWKLRPELADALSEYYPELDSIDANKKEDDNLVNFLKDASLAESSDSFEYVDGKKPKAEPIYEEGHKTYPRDHQTAINALTHANYKCEFDPEHPTFIRRGSNKPYTEPHHLIPMAFSDEFDVSLDREQNIVSLCSNCHNEIHYGRDARVLIEKLYEDRKELLRSAGIVISLKELLKMYGITD